MSQFFQIHPDNPQQRLIKQTVSILEGGGLVALPTDCCYALVCQLDNKQAVDRLRQLRGVDDRHHLTLLCKDLSDLSTYAVVDNSQYRLLKAATPGAFTCILQATKEVPRRLSHPSRKTVGLRVPDHAVVQAILQELGQPLIGTTLILGNSAQPLTDSDDIREQLQKRVELIIDAGACSFVPTTVIDLTGETPELIRKGQGNPALFGLD